MAVKTASRIDITLTGRVIISKNFGVSDPADLTDRERHLAYVQLKREIEMTARSLDEFERQTKQAAEYLQI